MGRDTNVKDYKTGAVCCTSIILQLRFLLKAKTWNISKKDKSGEVLYVWEEGVLRKSKNVIKGNEDIRENVQEAGSLQADLTYLTILPEQQSIPSMDKSKCQVQLNVVLNNSDIFLGLIEFFQLLKPW